HEVRSDGEAVQIRKLNVEEHDLRAQFVRQCESGLAVSGLADHLERSREGGAGDGAERRMVVDDQEPIHARTVADDRRLVSTGTPSGASGEPGPEDGGVTLKAVIADDSALLREGTARVLADHDFEIVGQAGTAEELLLKVRSYRPNVAVVDIRMPPTHSDEGFRAAKEIRRSFPEVGVLVLSQYAETDYATELLAESAEGIGYLLKDRIADIPEFVAAVRRVAEGGSALDPTIVSRLVGRSRRDHPIDTLTPREREVLSLMAEGLSNAAIASRLVVTERAVEKHVTSIFGKLRLPPD